MSDAIENFAVFSVAMPEMLHQEAVQHLLLYHRQRLRQENLCFALWRPSRGGTRVTALVHEMVLPEPGELELDGNVSFSGAYLDRASERAAAANSGLVLMHNHFGPGWQGMSPDDIATEKKRAPFALTSTGLQLVGMTLGTDGAWSARFWVRSSSKQYERRACENVRVVGSRLLTTFHPELRPAFLHGEELLRTISAWGEQNQQHLARIHVGIAGLGSVGRLVVEALARMGIQRVTLIDFDFIERLNLDRQLSATKADVAAGRSKVDLARTGFLASATAQEPRADAVCFAVSEPEGFAAALDCDVIFSCVDRPWGRQVLNHIAYAHLIPVIDGGIVVRTEDGKFKGAEWSVRTVGPGRCCLQCCGQFDPGLVDTERKGLLDDPSYIAGLPPDVVAAASQNVFPFSMSLSSHEVIQFIALVTGLLGRADFGEQRYHYNLGEMLVTEPACETGCLFQARLASGEDLFPRSVMTTVHPKAAEIREKRKALIPPLKQALWRRIVRCLARDHRAEER
jgi:molybdopterin-synthase adenylyltransferase